MEVVKLGPLRVRRVVKAAGETEPVEPRAPLTVVLMHGFGAPGDDLVGLARGIDAAPGTTFLFPEAPTSLADLMGSAMEMDAMDVMGDARAWWQIDVQRFERARQRGTLADLVKEVPDGLAAARDGLSAMLDALELDGAVRSERVVLGGFSQGSMLATDVALRRARPIAGLVVLSGTLIGADEWVPRMAARKDLPVFQSHGLEDPILPYSIAELLRRSLEAAGLRVDFRAFAGGHGIPPSVTRDLGAWLRRL